MEPQAASHVALKTPTGDGRESPRVRDNDDYVLTSGAFSRLQNVCSTSLLIYAVSICATVTTLW